MKHVAHPIVSRAFTLLLLPAFWACGGGDMADDAEMADTAAAPAAEMATEEIPAGPQEIPLMAVGESGVTGEAVATHTADSVQIVVEVSGLPGEGEYPTHVHSGTCASGGGVAAPLTSVMGTADGSGESETTIAASALSPDESHFVQVHATDGAPIACGDVQGHG